MPVQFQNFDYSYLRNAKPVFAPSDLGRKIGKDVKSQVEAAYEFDDFVYHLKKNGGHVAALHAHRLHKFFARIDIRRFFYSIARNRVQRHLAAIGIPRAQHYAKWSCVKNPYGHPSYVLPYGFIQSPILASLVLMESGVGAFLRSLEAGLTVSVYMDDISLSSNDLDELKVAFDGLRDRLREANFEVSAEKVCEPGAALNVFNCDLRHGQVEVQQERINIFHAERRSAASAIAFEVYCLSVEEGNI